MSPAVLLTRPAHDAQRFAARLAAARPGLRIAISPLMRILPATTLPDLSGAAGLIFTSRNAVRVYRALNGPPLPCHCVGDGTADEARQAGLIAMSARGAAMDLAARLARDRPDGIWWHLHGAHVRADLGSLIGSGPPHVRTAILYRQEATRATAEARAMLAGPAPVVAPIFSPRSGKLFANLAPMAAPLYLAMISDAAAAPLDGVPARCRAVADRPDADAMFATTLRLLEAAVRVEGWGEPQ